MPIISIDIPAEAVSDLKAAFNISDKTNAEAAVIFKQHLAEYIKLKVRQYRQIEAYRLANESVVDIIVT